MPDVVTAGETMVLGVPARPGRLRHAPSLELKIGGAESNVAIALSRLGRRAQEARRGQAWRLDGDRPPFVPLPEDYDPGPGLLDRRPLTR